MSENNPRNTEFGREAEKLAEDYLELNRKYTELLSATTASVEPVGSIDHVEWSASKEQWRHNIWADKKIPFGTKLYAGAPPAHIPADVETAGWCEYVAGMVDHWVRSDEYASIKTDEDRCTKAIAGIIERRLWALKPVSAPQAQQAVGEGMAVIVLATQLVEAVRKDEQGDGIDISAAKGAK